MKEILDKDKSKVLVTYFLVMARNLLEDFRMENLMVRERIIRKMVGQDYRVCGIRENFKNE